MKINYSLSGTRFFQAFLACGTIWNNLCFFNSVFISILSNLFWSVHCLLYSPIPSHIPWIIATQMCLSSLSTSGGYIRTVQESLMLKSSKPRVLAASRNGAAKKLRAHFPYILLVGRSLGFVCEMLGHGDWQSVVVPQ